MPYSPWEEAANSIQGTGNRLDAVAGNLAQMRYNQGLRQQQLALQAARAQAELLIRAKQLGIQEKMNTARTDLYTNQAAVSKEKAAQLKSLAEIARAAGVAQRELRLSKSPSTRYDVRGPSVLKEMLPPFYSGQDLATADLESALTESAAMSPTASASMMQPRNAGPNTVSYRPITGETVATGPAVLNAGDMVQFPGGPSIMNPKPPGSDLGNILGPLLSYIVRAQTPPSDEAAMEDRPELRTPEMFTPQYTNAVKLLNLTLEMARASRAAAQPSPGVPPPAPPPASTNEVPRQLKDGRVGIFDATTKQFLRYATQ